MKTKTLRKMSVVAIAGLMVFGMSGCSKDKDENLPEGTGTHVGDVNNIQINENEFPEKSDQEELKEYLSKINEDAYKLLDGKSINDLKDEDYKEFSEKYFMDNDNLYLSKKYVFMIHQIIDGYDGKLDDKYTKWENVSLEGRLKNNGYMPTQDVSSLRTDVNVSSLKSLSLSEITEENANYIGRGKYENWLSGNGLLEMQWLDNIREELLTNYPDMNYVPAYIGTFRFAYGNKYPENQREIKAEDNLSDLKSEDLENIFEYPSNTLDFILVKSINGWRMLECKWLFSTRNVINE